MLLRCNITYVWFLSSLHHLINVYKYTHSHTDWFIWNSVFCGLFPVLFSKKEFSHFSCRRTQETADTIISGPAGLSFMSVIVAQGQDAPRVCSSIQRCPDSWIIVTVSAILPMTTPFTLHQRPMTVCPPLYTIVWWDCQARFIKFDNGSYANKMFSFPNT